METRRMQHINVERLRYGFLNPFLHYRFLIIGATQMSGSNQSRCIADMGALQ